LAEAPSIKVHKYWRPAFVVIFILSKILLALAIYYFVEYRHAQKQIIQLEQQAGKKGDEQNKFWPFSFGD